MQHYTYDLDTTKWCSKALRLQVKFRLSEKGIKFEKIFHLEFDAKNNVKF